MMVLDIDNFGQITGFEILDRPDVAELGVPYRGKLDGAHGR